MQILPRFLLLLAIWFVGLLIFLTQGAVIQYVTNYQIMLPYFGTGLIVLLGAYALPLELGKSLEDFRLQMDIDDSGYQKLSGQMERYCFSPFPIILIALAMFIFVSGGANLFLPPVLSITVIWGYILVFVVDLMTATGIWLGASIWLTIFLISRRPLRLDLSQRVVAKFRRLTTLAIWFSLFYFLALTIGLAIPLSLNPSLFLGSVFYPLIAFILIGVAGILLPFYNIHNALLSIKRRELSSIRIEFEALQAQFEKPTSNASSLTEDTLPLMRKFFSLQLRERQVRLTEEWPIDITFISRLLLFVAIPVIVRIIIWLYIGLT
jgi:hypothetical protein